MFADAEGDWVFSDACLATPVSLGHGSVICPGLSAHTHTHIHMHASTHNLTLSLSHQWGTETAQGLLSSHHTVQVRPCALLGVFMYVCVREKERKGEREHNNAAKQQVCCHCGPQTSGTTKYIKRNVSFLKSINNIALVPNNYLKDRHHINLNHIPLFWCCQWICLHNNYVVGKCLDNYCIA